MRNARVPLLCMLLVAGLVSQACGMSSVRPAVTLSVERSGRTPRDASVYIDERYIGPLYYVAAHGVRLPKGEHRVTVTHDGYFPWDRRVEAGREPIALDVELVPIPD